MELVFTSKIISNEVIADVNLVSRSERTTQVPVSILRQSSVWPEG